jgi:hypothetical protein
MTTKISERQKNWSAATQRRLHSVSSTILGIKSVKSLGMEHKAAERIEAHRRAELAEATRFRRLDVAANSIGEHTSHGNGLNHESNQDGADFLTSKSYSEPHTRCGLYGV